MLGPMTDQPSPTPPEAPSTPPSPPDHQGFIVFAGLLAFVLLFVGAVGVAGMPGGGGAPNDPMGPMGAPGMGHGDGFGQQRHAERRAEHERRKAERQAERERRKAERREMREQRPGGGLAPALTQVTGTLSTEPAADGSATYRLETAAGTLVLEVGPPRYWGQEHPLAPFVGQQVTVTGIAEPGGDRLAVFAVGDQVIRGPGRPPWAGGWMPDGLPLPLPSTSPAP